MTISTTMFIDHNEIDGDMSICEYSQIAFDIDGLSVPRNFVCVLGTVSRISGKVDRDVYRNMSILPRSRAVRNYIFKCRNYISVEHALLTPKSTERQWKSLLD